MEENIPGYLQESFEASSLTIVEIIQILTHHGIALPSARQRKAFYVELLMNSLEKYSIEWKSELKKSKNPFQSFSKNPVVVSPLRKSPRRTPQKTPKSYLSNNEFSTPIRENSFQFSTPVNASPTMKTPYVVRTAQVSTVKSSNAKSSSLLYTSFLVLVVAMIIMSQQLRFCEDKDTIVCIPCPRFSKCSGREILSCTHPNWVKKRGWWMKDWNSYLILWPFNVEYCQDKSYDLAKEAKKLIKLGRNIVFIYNRKYA